MYIFNQAIINLELYGWLVGCGHGNTQKQQQNTERQTDRLSDNKSLPIKVKNNRQK